MKILYHHRTKAKEGQFVHIEEMLKVLREAGHEVVVVGPHVGEQDGFGARNRLVALMRRYAPSALSELLEFGYTAIAYARLRRAYLKHRPDILYERYSLFLTAGPLLKRAYGIPYLLEVNSPLCWERMNEDTGIGLVGLAHWSERTCWTSADAVLPVTRVLGDIAVDAGVSADRIHVIPNGIDPRRFDGSVDRMARRRALGLDGKTLIGFVGFFKPWHGLDRMIDALARDGGRRNLHLLVVGDGELRGALLDQARSLGVADRITVTGVVARDEVQSYVSLFDVGIQPKVTPYASPLKLFEYLALGVPIVAPDQPNIREVVAHGHHALLFPPDDPDAFTDAVLRLCDDETLRYRLGAAGRDLIASGGYTWAANAQRVRNIAERLMEDGRVPHLAVQA